MSNTDCVATARNAGIHEDANRHETSMKTGSQFERSTIKTQLRNSLALK